LNQRWKRLIIVPAIFWAIFCGRFTYDVIQQEKQFLYHDYIGKIDAAGQGGAHDLSIDLARDAQDNNGLQNYARELRELHWVFGPFFWASITLGGYIVAAGIVLPVIWRFYEP
jgi:hypothetical protein